MVAPELVSLTVRLPLLSSNTSAIFFLSVSLVGRQFNLQREPGRKEKPSSRDDVASDVDSTPTWPSTTAHSTSTGLDVTNTGYTGLIRQIGDKLG